MLIPEHIFTSPDIYPEKLDFPNKKLHCCEMQESGYRETAFLDHRIIKSGNESYILDIDKLTRIGENYQIGVTHYVFHNAFCCSTLFSRCLNALDFALILREPNILLEMASLHRYNGTNLLPALDHDYIAGMNAMLMKLLSRRYQHSNTVIIKPTDACNNIMGGLLGVNPDNKCLLMYSTLERFLTAVFKVPERAEWIKVRARELCLDEMKESGKLRVDPQILNQSQMAALVWVLHMEKFRKLMRLHGKDKVQVLDSQIFMKDQYNAVVNFLNFIKVDFDKTALSYGIRKLNQTHSKSNELTYSKEQRDTDFSLKRDEYSSVIDAGMTWAKSVFCSDLVCGLN